MNIAIQVKNLKKSFESGKVETVVLRGIDLLISEGEYVAIMGKSGAGKSTLLYQMGLLDYPSSGEVALIGESTEDWSEAKRTDFRLKELGYVFQDYALVPELSAEENVAIPLLMLGWNTAKAIKVAEETLDKVGLSHRLGNRPSQLSGGEQQRVSIARAIAKKPHILFADEPTANLDTASSTTIMEIFENLHKGGQTIVMVTHEKEYATGANRIVVMEDGQIIKEEQLNHPHSSQSV